MKTAIKITLLLIVSLLTGSVFAQNPENGYSSDEGVFDHDLNLTMLDGPSIPEALFRLYSEDEWYIGEGCYGLRKDQFEKTYKLKKNKVPGEPCSPYFRVDLGNYYFEGQLFYNPISNISGLIRGFDGQFYAVSSDFLLQVFRPEFLCVGLPISDWTIERCDQENLPYKTIGFTPLLCSGEIEFITLAGLYAEMDQYPCLVLEELPWCPVPIIVSEKILINN